MFFGTYPRTLDDKGRLQIPSKLVAPMPAVFYVLKGFEGCLSVYEEADFQTLLAKLSSLSYLETDSRHYIRLALSSASRLEVDPHGRIALSKQLADAYAVGQNIVIIGVLDHFEIWDASAYAKYSAEHASDYEALAEKSGK